ncbi:MAG: hypothetical protein NXI24_24100 [bacterium]|nr:hypothetical protein [bacterium]
MRYFPGEPVCRRDVDQPGNRDYYEPVEPYLERIGLPWFYFIADAKVQDWNPEKRRQYEDYFRAGETGD